MQFEDADIEVGEVEQGGYCVAVGGEEEADDGVNVIAVHPFCDALCEAVGA